LRPARLQLRQHFAFFIIERCHGKQIRPLVERAFESLPLPPLSNRRVVPR
jgi:hypothetical protein